MIIIVGYTQMIVSKAYVRFTPTLVSESDSMYDYLRSNSHIEVQGISGAQVLDA